ncbi:hypothetical protein [Bdellovibrio sp. HCB337]|uniref:hypothetical protein n=1 Tax=Bdellovibrio sp. HCB337 TaxID=3394358 RepID=UPI0039A77F75
MRLYVPILFLTLVLSGFAANAAPVIDHQPSPIDISPKNKSEPIYGSSQIERNWSFRLGFIGGALKETNQAEQMYIYGLRYDFLKSSLSTWQGEFMIGKDNFIHLVVGKKFYFPLETQTMPYYKFAVGDLIDSTDGIGSVLNLKKIQAMAAVGIDDMFHWNQRLQGEIGVSYALVGPQLEMSLGFAF